jgi:hypothetical protein
VPEQQEPGTQTWGFWLGSAAATLLPCPIRCFMVTVKSIELLWLTILHTRCMHGDVWLLVIVLILFLFFLYSRSILSYFRHWPVELLRNCRDLMLVECDAAGIVDPVVFLSAFNVWK